MSNPINQTILDVKSGKVTSKDYDDKVILVGSYFDNDSPYVDNLGIVINPGNGGAAIFTRIPYGGYGVELFLGDFNGDGRDEIMVSGSSGGSGGYAIASIYDYENGKLREIFSPDKFSDKFKVTGEYLEGKKVQINSLEQGEFFIYDISRKPKIYLDRIYDSEGKVNPNMTPSISAINDAFPISVPLKNNYYLFIRQRIVGVSNADTIGYVESFVNLNEDEMKLIQMGYYNFGEKVIKQPITREMAVNFKNIFPLGATIIQTKGQDGKNEIIKVDLDLDKEIEYIVPYTLGGSPYIGIVKYKGGKYILDNSYKGDGHSVRDIIIKKVGKRYLIFVGFEIDDNTKKLVVLTYNNGKLYKAFKNDEFIYSKIYIEDLNKDGEEELILWTSQSGEGYKIKIYNINENGLNPTEEYDEIYYKKVIKFYKNLLTKYKDSSTYLYYLAKAYMKVKDYENAIIALEKNLKTKLPYPSVKTIKKLKEKLLKE